jgi:hypothetical protein
MRNPTPNYPDGIYTIRTASTLRGTYGCVVELHAAGVVASRAVSRALMRSTAMVPLGLIGVINRSVEEWVMHPQGCEIWSVCFHYESLRRVLAESALERLMLIPPTL